MRSTPHVTHQAHRLCLSYSLGAALATNFSTSPSRARVNDSINTSRSSDLARAHALPSTQPISCPRDRRQVQLDTFVLIFNSFPTVRTPTRCPRINPSVPYGTADYFNFTRSSECSRANALPLNRPIPRPRDRRQLQVDEFVRPRARQCAAFRLASMSHVTADTFNSSDRSRANALPSTHPSIAHVMADSFAFTRMYLSAHFPYLIQPDPARANALPFNIVSITHVTIDPSTQLLRGIARNSVTANASSLYCLLRLPPTSTDFPDSIRCAPAASRVRPLADLLFFSYFLCRSSAVRCGSSAAYPEIDLPL
ncbi:hypothetical protein FB451DRAFT_1170639 [Mycena latifolia]|nr:hypothetical protein FB451DRAFT_1170639 [Mycena latifolia]